MKKQKILIVGGGSSGWMSAAFLSSQMGISKKASHLEIELVESEEVPTIGVGEATFHSMRYFLMDADIDEAEFLRACDATFKHGILFPGWIGCEGDDHYFHGFEGVPQIDRFTQSAHYTNVLKKGNKTTRWDHWSGLQSIAAAHGKAPRIPTARPLQAKLPYGYHLDANKFAHFLKQKCLDRGVKHTLAHIDHVETDGETIQLLKTKDGRKIKADYFVDCTGFGGHLIRKLGAKFVDLSHKLPVNRAVTSRGPLPGSAQPRPFTTSTARSNGWTFEIDLQRRSGRGYIYSSNHISDDDALAEFKALYPDYVDDDRLNLIQFPVGRLDRPWIGNCVAIGLSGSFLEPLESTGLFLVELALRRFEAHLTMDGGQQALRDRFNLLITGSYDHCAEFVFAHYNLSQRRDTAFWRDVTVDAPEWGELSEKLDRWRYTLPSSFDLEHMSSAFSIDSWQAVYFGMRQLPETLPVGMANVSRRDSEAVLTRLQNHVRADLQRLPSHKQLLDQTTLLVFQD